ncbi:DM13 domain-containing protein [Parasediminibacterium sp. JCM 36343]|uniref:DM13 domain-containing protein n=1 Tax=Parasediminibacterium sp. JCM 36343 TaxID=3374279 RepID=UPI00397A9A7F
MLFGVKHIIIVTAIVLSIASCTKEATSTATLNERIDSTTTVAKLSGSFISGPYGTTSGKATIYKTGSSYQLALENFAVSNGPDLKVYISKEMQPVHFVKLGSLKSTNGNQLYDIPASIDLTEYKYALIHCEQYNHLFGYAGLN